jgi:hypothetical protein
MTKWNKNNQIKWIATLFIHPSKSPMPQNTCMHETNIKILFQKLQGSENYAKPLMFFHMLRTPIA